MMIRSKLIVHNQQSSKFEYVFMRVLVGFSFLILLWIQSAFSYTLEGISNGLNRDSIPSSLKKAMWNASGGPYIADGLVEAEDNKFYFLSGAISLAVFNKNNNEVSGGWPITTNETCRVDQGCKFNSWHRRWSKDEVFEPEVIERFYNYDVSMRPVYNSNVKTLGCLGDAPLKYGDVDGNGENELVMYIENSLIIFSPQLHKTIFMSMIDVKDWYTQSQTISHLSEHRMDGAPLEPGDPQFQSRLATFVRGGDRSNLPGYRGYAKLFFEDFDGDENGTHWTGTHRHSFWRTDADYPRGRPSHQAL